MSDGENSGRGGGNRRHRPIAQFVPTMPFPTKREVDSRIGSMKKHLYCEDCGLKKTVCTCHGAK